MRTKEQIEEKLRQIDVILENTEPDDCLNATHMGGLAFALHWVLADDTGIPFRQLIDDLYQMALMKGASRGERGAETDSP